MRSRALPSLALLLILCAAATPHAQQLRKIGEMELALVGLSATVDGARPAIPKNVASGVKILISGGGSTLTPGAAARLLGAFDVEAELSGPAFGETITVRQSVSSSSPATELVLPLPAMAVSGEHTLSNLRIVSGGRPVLDLQPQTVTVDVVEQVLITSVRTRPLTLQEIKDKGIVLDSDDYLGFEFTLGVLLESKPVNINFPVVFDRAGISVPLPQQHSLSALEVDVANVPVVVPKMVPMMMKVPKLGPGTTIGFAEEDIRIPSLLVIPGEVGYLKQFFSAQLFVGNGTPATANLSVRDLKGTLELPKGLDATPNTADDPLAPAETVNGVQPLTMAIAQLGPDGKPGTEDDVTSLRPGEQGMAEFLVRGDLEGFHNITFDIEGVLDGLPTGPVTVTGRASGGVLVRNPFFDVSFTLPTVVRAQEPFKLYATVTNKGQGVANDVSMTLDGASLSGLEPIGDTTKTIETLKPGEAETLVFDFLSLRTGQAVATYLRFEGPGATGSLKFKVGVGERGVPLSPDTLILPAQVEQLPDTLINAAMRVLGQAWSLANTPPDAMPPGVTRVSKTVVTNKALALAEAGLRIRLGQPAPDAIRDLLGDFYGPAPVDRGFDQLLRMTDAGRNFNRALGATLAPTASGDAAALEESYSRVAASGKDFVAFSIANGASGADVDVRLTDAANRALIFTGSDSDPRPAVTSAAIAPLGPPSSSPLFGVIAAPASIPYTLELTGRGGTPVDLSVTYPSGDGSFTRARAVAVSVGPGAKARVVIDPARASPELEIDADANGSIDSTVPLQTEVITASGPRLLSASVIGPEILEAAGPFGFHVALLFDRVVSETAAADVTQYSVPDNHLLSASRQLSGRLIFGTLAQPEGPYVPTSMAVSGMTDPRGASVGPQSMPMQAHLPFPGAVVSGRVINSDGQLASGIRVIYSGDLSWNDCQTPLPYLFTQVMTDASGRYQFRYVMRNPCSPSWGMTAHDDIQKASRRVSGSVRTPGERVTADIALLGRGGVTGIIRDFAGNPVPDAQVVAVSTLEPAVGGSARSDGDGRYTISGITVGPISVKSAKGASVGTAAGQIVRAGTVAAVDVTLNAGSVSMSGVIKQVVNGVATPAADAIVVFYAPDPLGVNGNIAAGAMRSGPDGSYAFTDLPTGPYSLKATTPTGDSATVTGAASAGDEISGRDVLIAITRNARVSGIVRFADGSVAPRPIVMLSSVGIVGEEDGTFVLENAQVQPNAQTITAYSSDGLREGTANVLLNQSGQQLANVLVTLNGIGTLDVVVLDPLGQPVRNQVVQISRNGRNISPTDCSAFYLATTDDAGRAQFAGLEVGSVRVVAIRATANGVDIAKLDTTIPHEGAIVSGVMRFGGGGIIRGTVRDDQNNPVFGANIEVASQIYSPQLCAMVGGVSHRIRTSLNGEYRVTGVPVGPVSISASQEFFPTPVGAARVLARDGDELVIDLKLIHTTAGKVTGKVFLPDGVTLAGAGVTVSAIGALPEVLVSTNAEGEYAFPKIFPAGGLTVTVRDPLTGYVAQEHLSVSAGQDLQHNFRLKGRGHVRIKVVDGAGVPVSNALVSLTESDFPRERFEGVVESSNEGVVTFANVHEGDFSVTASDAFGRGGRVSGELPGNGATVDVTVGMTVTGTVTGRFLMPDGTPIPYGIVKLVAAGRSIGQTSTESGDDPGRFSFTYVPAGTVRLEGLDPATGRSGIAVGQLTTQGQVVELDVRAVGLGTVAGRVTSNGMPQEGASVTVSSGTFKATANADGDGHYSIPGVPEGAISVSANLGGALYSTASGTLLGDGASVTIDVALLASGTVAGVVTAADGITPAPPSIVTLQSGNTRYTTTTNDLGEYRFALVPAGTRSVTVDVIGSIDTARGTTTVTGGQTSTLPLQLIGVGSIAGTAQTAGGAPVGGTITLTGQGDYGWSTTLTVGADGSFTAAQVLAGPFSAQVRNTVGNITLYGTATGVVSPSATTNIVVSLQSTGSVRGTVMRADGTTPAIGATVTLRSGGSIRGTSQAFSDGAFEFEGLPLGTYTVDVYDLTTDGYARALDLVLAANGDEREAALVLDTNVPMVESIVPADGATGVSRTQPIVITFSDALSGTGGVNLKKGAAAVSNSRSLSADGRVLTMTGTWPDSSELTIEVTTAVQDLYGRHVPATVTSRFVTVDTTAPGVASVAPLHDAYQVSTSATIVATFSEPIANTNVDGLITVTRGGTPVAGTWSLSAANAVTFTPESLSDNAIYMVSVDGAVDASGNEQGSASVTTFATTDTVAPVVAFTAPAQGVWLTDNTPFISVQRSDATSGINAMSGTLAIGGVAVTPSKSVSSMTYTVPVALADGTYTLDATSADRAGNTGASQASVMIDTTAPAAPVITDIGGGTTIAGTATIAATADDATSGVARIEIFRDASKILDLLPPSFTGTWNAASTADGHHSITARAIDNAGNIGPASAPLSVMVNNHPLSMAFVAPAANTKVRDTVSVTLSTNEPVDHIDVTVGTTTVTWTGTTTSFSGVLSLATAPEGTTTITAIAYGLQGDDPVTTTRNVIVDRVPPSPPDVTRINAEPPTANASLVFGAAGAVEAGAIVRLTNTANGATATATATANGSFTASIVAAVDDVLSITASDAMANQSAATLVAVRRVPSLPAATGNTSLQYEGLIADRVGAAAGALTADGAPDAVFTLNLSIGAGVTRTLSYIELSGGMTRSTRSGVVLGVAADAGAQLLNNPNGTVSFPITTGATLTLFASNGGFIVPNGRYVVTAAFTDGTQFVAEVTIVAPEDRTAVAHTARVAASPATVRVTSASNPGTAVLTLTDIRDLDGTRVPDGAKIAIGAADMATKDPGGAFIRSAGGAILDGTPAPNNPNFQVFTIVNGAVTATYSSQPVMPASLLGALAVIQVIAADANGNILGNEAISTFDLPLRAATDPGTVVASPSSYFVDKGDRRSRLTISVPLPDGSKVAVTASNNSSIVNGFYVNGSAGGTILGGAPSSSGSQWAVFTVTGGTVEAEYSPGTMLVNNRQTKTVNVQVVPANASGAITSTTPLAIGTITLTGAAAAEVKFAHERLPVLTVPQTSQIVVHHVHDTRANLLPDGVNVLMTVNASTLINPSGFYYSSAGGLITDGQVPADTRFRYFPLSQGEVIATYSPSTITTNPGDVKTATVSVTVADPSGVMIDQWAIGSDTIQLLGPSYGTPASVTPTTLLADGGAHVATASFGPILDAYGNTVPDGTRVVVSVSHPTGINPSGFYYTSVGGVLLDGDVSPSGNSYRAYTVENGAITVTYANQNITALPGQQKTVTVMLMEANADGSVGSQWALGAVPLTLTGTTSATMTASVTSMHGDGADRRSTITVSNVRDSLGQLVPDGTKIGITAATNSTVGANGFWTASAGGTIIGGTVASDTRFRIFTLQNGQAVFEYSAEGVIVSSGQNTARVQLVPMSQSGVILSSNTLASVPIELLALSGATVTATPADLFADNAAHLSQITISNLTDAGGVQVPDGAKVALTVTPQTAVDPATGQYVQTAGGVLQSAGTTAGDGTPATNDSRYQIFTVADGRVLASYSDVNINAGVGQTKVARVSVKSATTSGAVQSNLITIGAINLHGTTSTIASGPATATRTGGAVQVTFSGIKDAAGTVVPDGTLVAVTAATNVLKDEAGANVTSTGGSIVDGTTSPSGANYKVFPVQNGTITVTYSPAAAGVGTARIAIAPALSNGATNGNKALLGGIWAITIQ